MNFISHILLSNLVYKELPLEIRWWVIVFGVLPDVLSFAGIYRLKFLKKMLFFNRGVPHQYLPLFIFFVYNITHSILIWACIWLFLKFVLQADLAALIFTSWGLHILVDIFTHNSKSTLVTRIFWPVSRWYFHGLNWSSYRFLLFEYSMFAILYWIFYF